MTPKDYQCGFFLLEQLPLCTWCIVRSAKFQGKHQPPVLFSTRPTNLGGCAYVFGKKAIMHFAMSAQNCAQESTTLASLGTYGPLINKQTNDIESNLFVLFLLKLCQVNRFKRKWEIKPRISRSMHVCAISCWPTTRISTANVKCTGQPVLKVDFVINFCALSSIHSIKRRCRSRSGPTDEYQNGWYMKKPDETWTHLIHWWCHVF